MKATILWILVTVAILFRLTFSQIGGSYDLSHSVIASGGGSNSNGGAYTVDGTAGQAVAGVQSSNAGFSLTGGFWAVQQFAPTAAGVSISGRVVTAEGFGITKVTLVLTNLSTGESRTAHSSSFGYFRFDGVSVGQLYAVTVSAKRYTFEPDTRVFNVVDELTDVEFVALRVQ